MTEEWNPVVGFENSYHISNFGRVKSLSRIRKGKSEGTWQTTEKILSQSVHKSGYRHVTLFENGERSYVFVHILIAKAFIPNPDNKPQVNHKNGIKSNNVLSNLEWVTVSENGKHSYALGFQKPRKGENNELCKLSFNQVCQIRLEYSNSKITHKELSKKYSISSSRICHIINYKVRINE